MIIGMRDTLKSALYFERYLENENRKIEKYKIMAEKLRQDREGDDEGLKRVYIIIQNSYFNKLNCLYSMGASIDEIKKVFPEIIEIMNKSWNKDSGYVRLVWMLSIGIMIDVPYNYINQLETMVKKGGLQDYLVEFLLRYENDNLNNIPQKIMLSDPYAILFEVINAENKDLALEKLKYYLQEKWYQGHEDTGWYDAHKSNHDTYNGYWSFESGAIAKILKLDDLSLKDIPYYPYDMVHYQAK